MVDVTQEDYATAKAANLVWASAINGPSVSVIAAAIARIAAENAALERAAKVADRHDTGDMQREDMEARAIASAIRNLKGPSND